MRRIHSPERQAVRDDLKARGFSILSSTDIRVSPDLDSDLAGLESVYEESPSDGPCRRRFYGRYVLGPHATIDTLDLRTNSSLYLELRLSAGQRYQSGAAWRPAILRAAAGGHMRERPPERAHFLRFARIATRGLLDQCQPESCPGRYSPPADGCGSRQTGSAITQCSPPGWRTIHVRASHQAPKRARGESQVFRNVPVGGVSAPGELLLQTTLMRCLDTLVIWDKEVFHHVTPITVEDGSTEGTRDVLLIDFTPFEECKVSSTGAIAVNLNNFCLHLDHTRQV